MKGKNLYVKRIESCVIKSRFPFENKLKLLTITFFHDEKSTFIITLCIHYYIVVQDDRNYHKEYLDKSNFVSLKIIKNI